MPAIFDYANVMHAAVGGDGLSPADLDEKRALAALDTFRLRVEQGHVGFPLLPEERDTVRAVQRFHSTVRAGIEDVLVLGIGGSALGAYALDVAMRGPHPFQHEPKAAGKSAKSKAQAPRPRLWVLDNVDPGIMAAALARLDPRRTMVCVIAKSGSTAETMSTFLVVREWMGKKLGRKAAAQIVAITDSQKGDLLQIAKSEQYPLFFIPANVGGRFSIFTPVGLVPAALLGFDVAKLMRGARDANALAWQGSLAENPALAAALVHHALHTKRGKSIEVVFAYSSYLWGAAFWYRQLWAESIGKRVTRAGEVVETGQTPVAALGVTDQHSQLQLYMEGPRDKMITFWAVGKHRAEVVIPRALREYDSTGYLGGKKLGALLEAERRATEAALTAAGRPNCRWTLPRVDEYTLGAFFQLLEYQTAFAGELYGVDAFDQPGVELGKKLTYGLMGRKGYKEFAARVK